MTETTPLILISGASSRIAQAILQQLATQRPDARLLALSGKDDMHLPEGAVAERLTVDLTDPACVEYLGARWRELGRPDQVYCCNGVLHDSDHRPEKSIREFDADWLHQSLTANVVSHAHLAQSLHPLISRKQPLHWLSLSAKVGSITDNGMGGWHSYRMSKAALNMLVCNLDIEWRRKHPDNRIVAVHPGTTDTPLSEPFQAGLPADKLYSPALTASRMIAIMENLTEQQSGKLLFWDGEVLPF